MELSINAFYFQKAGIGEAPRSHRECIDLVADAGFRLLDVGAPDVQTAEDLSAYIQEKQMKVLQTHIPYNRYKRLDYSQHAKLMMETAEIANILKSSILVVHGDEFDFENQSFTPEAGLEFNYRFFSPLVEFAAANGMRVAFENVFQDLDPIKKPRFCANVEDLCRLVDAFHCDTVGICWDCGHAKVQYKEDYLTPLKTAGSRVITTHIHDNYYGKDLHLFPFWGDTDWQGFIRTLRETGYHGAFNFELSYNRIPKALAGEYLNLLRKSAEYILNFN